MTRQQHSPERLAGSYLAVLHRLAENAPPTGVRAGIDPGVPGRPLEALVRFRYGPEPLDFDGLAVRHPAVQSGLSLAGEADLELHLACTDQRELRTVVAELRHAGASHVQVEPVLRRMVPTTRRTGSGPAPPRAAAP